MNALPSGKPASDYRKGCTESTKRVHKSNVIFTLGSLIIQKKLGFTDSELVEQITENPYLQYFIGLPGYQEEPPFDASTLVLFRKRLSPEIIMEANDYILNHDDDDDKKNPPSKNSSEKRNGEKV